MELVYLWVKEYKNIKKQGFNFSPRFECKYDEVKNELTVDEKKDYVSIFPENINVTAIVGENGSGKSGILSSIVSKQIIFLVVFDKGLKVYTRYMQIETSYTTEKLNNVFLKNILYYSIGNKYLSKTMSNLSYIDIEKTVELIVDNYSELEKYNFSIFDFVPEFIIFRFKYDYKLFNHDDEINENLISGIKSALDWNPETETDIIYEALHALQNLDDDYLNYLLYQFEDIAYLFEHINLTEKLHPKDGYLILDIKNVQKELKKCELHFINKNEFETLKEYEDNKIRIKDLKKKIENYKQLLFQLMHDDLDFNFFSENGASFNSLSDGEKTIYTFLVNLIEYKQKDFFFLLDEPDNTLHPDWQKKFLDELIKLLQKLEKKVHILLTTHSPFLLSDLPKENVIFLQRDEKGNCNNVTKETDINPFGANIHTLLSHGFFMKDGMMGEFAKTKIQEVIDFLNNKKTIEELSIEEKQIKPIIESIGEPFLKRKLLDIYYRKYPDESSKEARKHKLLAEQRRIEQQLKDYD